VICAASVYRWRAKFGGMDTSLMKRMKELEDENRRLKKIYAEERHELHELNLFGNIDYEQLLATQWLMVVYTRGLVGSRLDSCYN
jgi:hypothetical protein